MDGLKEFSPLKGVVMYFFIFTSMNVSTALAETKASPVVRGFSIVQEQKKCVVIQRDIAQNKAFQKPVSIETDCSRPDRFLISSIPQNV